MERGSGVYFFRSWLLNGSLKWVLLPVLFLFFFRTGSAQIVIKPFEPRYKAEQPGGIVYVSNSTLTCATCDPNSASSQNDSYNSKYIDIDGSSETFSSSSADLNLPSCSSVTFAGLYWGGAASSDNPRFSEKNQVKLKLPGGSYTNVVADVDFGIFQDQHYQYFKDVTALVSSAPVINGTYYVGNVVADEKVKRAEAGWTLVIVYRQDLEPVRNLTVFDGFAGIPNGAPDLRIPIQGFLTPPAGPVSFELGFVAYEGDRTITGDYMEFNGRRVQDAAQPTDNTFNSTVTRNGSMVTSRNPAYKNTLGYDASIFKPDNSTFQYLPNSATTADITMATKGDLYAVGVVTTAIDVYNPSYLFSHAYRNLSGAASVSPGEEVEFEYTLRNIGLDQSSGTLFSDLMPEAFLYVPGTLEVQYEGGAWTRKTDAANDDESEFLAAGNRIVFRLGTGATATSGGVVNPQSTIRIRYRARLTADCDFLRCSAPAISKYAELSFSGTINKDNRWTVQSAPPPAAGSCVTTGGPLTIPLSIPMECQALPADRTLTSDCEVEVTELDLPFGYQLYRAEDTAFTTPLSRVTASGSYLARRLIAGGCAYTFKVNMVLNQVKILSQPVSVSVCPGEEASFNVSASGTGNLVRWQKLNGTVWADISGATDSTLRIQTSSADDGSQYRAVVRRSCGPSETSAAATLSLNAPAFIQVQPEPLSLCEDSDGIFQIAATGDNLRYQWQTSHGGSVWTDISGATGKQFILASISRAENGSKYRVIVSGNCGNLISSAALLTVTPKPDVTLQPASQTVCEGTDATFTVQATGEKISYQWQTDHGKSSWSDLSGATGSELTVVAISARNGFRYRAVISSTCGVLISEEARLSVTPQAVITLQPSDLAVCQGEQATFAVQATGEGVSFQWQSNHSGTGWTNIDGANASFLTITGEHMQNGLGYRVTVTSACGSVTSAEARLTVLNKTTIAGQPESLSVCEGSDAIFRVQASGQDLKYQWQTNYGGTTWASVSGATASSLVLKSTGPGQHGDQFRVLVTGACGAVTSEPVTLSVNSKPVITGQPVSVTACADTEVHFRVSASGDELTYQWQVRQGDGNWTSLAGETSASLTVTASKARNGQLYRVLVTGTCGTVSSETAFASAKDCQSAAILSGPGSLALCAGDPAAFGVRATGENIRYQWQSRPAGSAAWTDVEQAAGPVLDLGRVSYSQNGTAYRVVIRTNSGTLESAEALLTVNALPVAQADYFKAEGQLLSGRVDGNDTDADQDVLRFAILSAPEHGTWKLAPDGSFSYIPEAGWSGTTTGRYSVTDGKCTVTAPVTFQVTVVPPVSNDNSDGGVQPHAEDDFFKTAVDQPVSGLVGLNDAIDQIRDPVFSATSQPASGTLEFRPDGTFSYTPKKGFTGKDTFTYRVCTPEGLCSSARVEITVVPYTVVNLTPGLSEVREGGQVFVTATLGNAFHEDVVIRLSYKGKAVKDTDYELSGQFQTIRIPKGQLTTSDRIRLFAAVDNLEEDPEDVIIEIAGTSHDNVRIGSGAIVIIHNSFGPVASDPGSASPDSKYPEPQPLVSPNGDNHNDYFQIRNIDNFPNNEVLIFNRWGNEVFRMKGYNEGNGRVFRGNSNRGLTIGNDDLPDGVYYYLITPDTSSVQAASDLLKGYLILKRN